MKTHNAGPKIPGIDQVSNPRERRLAAFDALPRRVRDALNYGVISFCPIACLEEIEVRGEVGILRWLEFSNELARQQIRAQLR